MFSPCAAISPLTLLLMLLLLSPSFESCRLSPVTLDDGHAALIFSLSPYAAAAMLILLMLILLFSLPRHYAADISHATPSLRSGHVSC